MQQYFEFVAKTPLLVVSAVLTVGLLVFVFPSLPIPGDMLDMMSNYSFEEAMAALSNYGDDGRIVYFWSSLTIDTLLPISYVSLCAGLIYRFRLSAGLWYLAYLPVIAGGVDLLENIQIMVALQQFPDVGRTQVFLMSTFSSVKGILVPCCMFVGVALMLIAGIKNVIARLSKET